MFGVTDEDIINAVRYHTSGRPGMSDLEKLIFLCDMLEEGRDYEGVDKLRKIFRRDMDECAETALHDELEYLESSGKEMYPLTKEAYNYFCELNKSKQNISNN